MSSVIEPLLDGSRVARILGIEVQTLGVWRRRGYGPRWYKIGKNIKYSLADVHEWMAAQASARTENTRCIQQPQITAEQLTVELARRVMGWGVGPDRFLKGGRRWAPRWHFQPLRRLEHALQLVQKASVTYSLSGDKADLYTAHVSVGDRGGTASGRSESAVITVALARAIGIDVPDELLEACGE